LDTALSKPFTVRHVYPLARAAIGNTRVPQLHNQQSKYSVNETSQTYGDT